MSDKNDPRALLLQVVAHDLLAPLTAVKWQCELLERPGLDEAKRKEYVLNIHRSAELGITISKHAHTAARVLGDTYSGTGKDATLHEVLHKSFDTLTEQYARHGLQLKTTFDAGAAPQKLDVELLGFYAWLTAKYFLTLTPAGALVEVTGTPREHYSSPVYALDIHAEPIVHPEQYTRTFSDDVQPDGLDQTYVFVQLIRHVAPMLNADSTLKAGKKRLTLSTVFAVQ